MGIARHFSDSGIDGNNNSGDYLSSPASNESYTGMTFAAWVKQDYPFPSVRAGLAGRLFNATSGWAFFVSPTNLLTFFATGDPEGDANQFQTVTCPDLTNWMYIAVTYLAAGGADNVKFYAGNTTDTFSLIGTATRTGNFNELGAFKAILFGNVNQGLLLTGGPVVQWNGSMDKIGLWFGPLTIEQLRESMFCDTHVDPTGIKALCDVEGLDPEPGISINLGAFNWDIRGTEVENAPGIGCEYNPYHSPPFLRYPWGLLGSIPEIPPVIPPPTGVGTVAVNWPIRHFTMPEFTPGTTPLLGLKDPYILASDNTETSKIYAISHDYKSDAGTAIRCELETGNITHGTMNQKRCEYYRFYIKRVDGGTFTLYIDDENQGFDAGETINMDPLDTSEYVVAEVRSMGVYRSRRLKIVHTSATDDFELVRVEEGFTVLGR